MRHYFGQVERDLKTVSHVGIKDKGYSQSSFWNDLLDTAIEQVESYVKKQSAALFSTLPASLQLEGTERPISLRVELSSALVCMGDEMANVAAKEFLYFELPEVTPGKVPIYENAKFAEMSSTKKFDRGNNTEIWRYCKHRNRLIINGSFNGH